MELRQQEDLKIRAESDLNAVRDLCVKLDQQKDNLLQQLGEKDSVNSQVRNQVIEKSFLFSFTIFLICFYIIIRPIRSVKRRHNFLFTDFI